MSTTTPAPINVRARVLAIWSTPPCPVTGLNPCQHCVEALVLEVREAALEAVAAEAEPEPPEPQETKPLSRVMLVRMFVRLTKEQIANRIRSRVAVK